ncbi:beta-lactamase-like protein 2 homolog [Prorops nasuta]|uniref:beta-lactamase-like protein 2 homolog n=1 Tax=Prorops nasuta TaxID=863751 RepID=UPI0034CFA6D9
MTSMSSTIPLLSKLSSKVIRILGCNPGPMTLQGTNTYLVGTGDRRILIDTGDTDTADKYIKLLSQVLTEEKATIQHVIITHWHHDHIGGVNSVQKLLENISAKPATVWKLPRAASDDNARDSENSVEWQALTNGQLLEVEGASLKIEYTPGHTTDHACLVLQDDEILFSGDCILGAGTAVFEDLHDYLISLKKILTIAPKIIYPGHGPVLNDPIPQIEYYIRHRQEREREILQVLEKHGPAETLSEIDIVQHIYRDTPKALWPAAASNVQHHLEKLRKEEKVKGYKGKWSIVQTLESNL